MFIEKYVSPFTDFGFKKLFGTEPNKDLLIDFLNEAVLPKQRRIIDLNFRSTEQLGASAIDRGAVFDLYCQGSNGERFIVEMQKAKQDFFRDRSVFYATFPIQEQAIKGDNWNFKLSEIYTVGILDFVFHPNEQTVDPFEEAQGEVKARTEEANSDVRHIVQLKDQHGRVFYNKLFFIYFEMPKFKKTEAELVTLYDKWLYVLKNLSSLESRPARLQEKVFSRLFEAAEIAKFTYEERTQYQASLKYYWDTNNVINTAKREGKEEGVAEGIVQGKAEGIAEGKAEGIAEGKAEGIVEGKQELRNAGILKALKSGKLTIEEIAEFFETTPEEVLKIKRS